MPSSNFRCKRCEINFLKHVANNAGTKNVFVDMSKIVSRCKIPRFTHSKFGHAIVVFWDCEKQKEVMYTQKEYENLRASGEL